MLLLFRLKVGVVMCSPPPKMDCEVKGLVVKAEGAVKFTLPVAPAESWPVPLSVSPPLD